jgi:predicted acyl esterase
MDDVRIEYDLRIPLRDGTRLAANLYRPAAPGRYPALLQYTPYLKDGMGVPSPPLARDGHDASL